jgi:serine protease
MSWAMHVPCGRLRAGRWGCVALVWLALCADAATVAAKPYACENDLIEVMFAEDSRVRLRGGTLVDLQTKAVDGTDAILAPLAWHEWLRITDVPEDRVDELNATAVSRSGAPVYNMNNVYRLRIPEGHDIWELAQAMEALPGVILARPVPKPMPAPLPPDYEPGQGYLLPASAMPCGIDAIFANGLMGGDGSGVTICDLEYSWNYSHADISKAFGSQINTNVADPFNDNNHGTAVIGMLVADQNGWGTSGICPGANLLTCGTYYGSPSPSWNVPGALTLAASYLQAGDVVLLEQQWDYTSSGGYIPIEWWLNYSPSGQTFNGVYAAITNLVALGINVVEAGGNGSIDTGPMSWYGNSGAAIVGAGGAYAGGTYPEGDLQRLSFSSYGWRFDLHGWGENVVTTGYGDLYNAMGANYYYTLGFAGTSSASPMVAGAMASCVGYWYAHLSPTPLRAVVISIVRLGGECSTGVSFILSKPKCPCSMAETAMLRSRQSDNYSDNRYNRRSSMRAWRAICRRRERFPRRSSVPATGFTFSAPTRTMTFPTPHVWRHSTRHAR